MLEVNNLKKIYNGVTVVNIPAMQIGNGEFIGLVGNNGAGKTTFFRLILDLIRAEEGAVKLKGEVVAKSEHWKSFTAAHLDEGFLIDYLSPEEYFYFVGSFSGLSKADVDAELLKYVEFFNGEILAKNKYIRDLSKGNQFKVGIVACLIQKPDLLMLDEPFANIDPSTQIRLKSLLVDYNSQYNTTILLSSHDLNHVTDVSKRILLMEKGEIFKDIQTDSGTREELEEYFSVMS